MSMYLIQEIRCFVSRCNKNAGKYEVSSFFLILTEIIIYSNKYKQSLVGQPTRRLNI